MVVKMNMYMHIYIYIAIYQVAFILLGYLPSSQ